MNADEIIQAMGGRAKIMQITGLSKSRISQWSTANRIPAAWMVAFRALNPSLGTASWEVDHVDTGHSAKVGG